MTMSIHFMASGWLPHSFAAIRVGMQSSVPVSDACTEHATIFRKPDYLSFSRTNPFREPPIVMMRAAIDPPQTRHRCSSLKTLPTKKLHTCEIVFCPPPSDRDINY